MLQLSVVALSPASLPQVCATDRTLPELSALIKEHEGVLARLRSERRNALRLARAAGSADAYASLALPSTARSGEWPAWFSL